MFRQPRAPWRKKVAWFVALTADFLQVIFFPMFGAGALSPFEDGLDAAVGVAMVLLLGWNWVFLPAFAAEMIPGADLAPTWTLAVFLATRKDAPLAEREVVPAPVTSLQSGRG